MSDASTGFFELILRVWTHREHIMRAKTAQDRTYRIYEYYNHFEGIRDPDFCELLSQIELQFSRCPDLKFKFQGVSKYRFRGDDIATMAGSLNDLLSQDSSMYAILKSTHKKIYSSSYYDRKARTYRAPKTSSELIQSDPAFLLDQFLIFISPKAESPATYRIYVTPQTIYSPKVFVYLVRKMNMLLNLPASGKLIIPGPKSNKRADKIVLYCQSKQELDGGIALLKTYQDTFGAHMFEDFIPLSTKPVKGLKGVSVTIQPTPDQVIMHYAGIEPHRIQGISFGMSRCAVISLALGDHYKKNGTHINDDPTMAGQQFTQFLDNCHKLARLAKIDITQSKVN